MKVNFKGIFHVTRRLIYCKNKELDRATYKPTDREQLDVYIKNYMQDDNISEEQKLKFIEEAKQQQVKQQQDEQPVDQKFINPAALKEMFDKMVEIDSDPTSKRAQDYYNKLEELERKNPNKKKSQIIIKTMRKGKTVNKESYPQGQFIGQSLSQEEQECEKKFIDMAAVSFPEINPVDIIVKSKGKELKLANYRFPSQTPDRKGIIYFVNGYGDYCRRYAFFAQTFAQAGYDFVCLDPRGFGHSEGKRAFIESEESMLEDQLKFSDLIEGKFGGKTVPKLQLGVSLGGLISLKMALAKPNFFNGMGLIAPYLQLLPKQQEVIDSKMGLLKLIDKFIPSLRVPIPQSQRKLILSTKHLQTINKDPLLEIDRIAVRNLIVNEQSMKRFHSKEAEQTATPFIMILGGKDQVVSNKVARDFFEVSSSKVQDKDIVTYDDADHFLLLDNEFSSLVSKDLIGWFNTHV